MFCNFTYCNDFITTWISKAEVNIRLAHIAHMGAMFPLFPFHFCIFILGKEN